MKILTHKSPWSGSIEFLLVDESLNSRAIAGPPTFKQLTEPVAEHIEPTFRLRDEACQDLMDQLWQVGFRPSEGSGSAGALAATQKHLEDMRRLVFIGKAEAPPQF